MAGLRNRLLSLCIGAALGGGCTGSIPQPGAPTDMSGGAGGLGPAPMGGMTMAPGAGGSAMGMGGMGGGVVIPPPPPMGPDGNDITPAQLTCNGADAPASPARIWRLTALEWTATVAGAISGTRPASPTANIAVPRELSSAPFTYRSSDSFSTFSRGYAMTEGEFEEAAAGAAAAAKLIVAALKGRSPCVTTAADAASLRSCLAPLVAERGELLFRRPLTDEETARYADVAATNLGKVEGGAEGAVLLTFEAMLMAPQFLFRVEAGSRSGTSSRLTPYEIASALSYTLMRRPPDVPLWEAAKGGRLSTPEQIRAQVERIMLARLEKLPTEDYERGAHGDYSEMRFLSELFHYSSQPAKGADLNHPGGWGPDLAVTDTNETLKLLFKTSARKDFLKQLLTTRTWVIRGNSKNMYGPSVRTQLRPHPEVNAMYNQTVTLPEAERAGVMSMPAFIAAFSAFDHNLPVQRGRFIREVLLCTKVPELPIGVVPPLPDLGERSRMRDRLKIHSSNPACEGCHKVMDPLGLPFEQYDHVGYQRGLGGTHYTKCCNYTGLIDETGPVDMTGALIGAGPVDGPITGGVPELMQKLSQSPVVEQCFVRQSFRYWLGRAETPHDGCTLKAAQEAYSKSGGDLVALVAALLASPANLTRNTN